MKVLVTGVQGQLGGLVVAHAPGDWDVVAVDLPELDLTRLDQIAPFVTSIEPEAIINCAAFTDVDGAEAASELCWTINAEAPQRLAQAAAQVGARMIQLSTDYVFDGMATSPYPESTALSGLGVYGRSKAAGEVAVQETAGDLATIVRTAWLYAPGPRNFVATMLRLAGTGQSLRVVDDQTGQPTYADDVARRLIDMVFSDAPSGIYHATNSGQTTWFGFTQEILKLWGYDNPVEPVTSADFSRPAPRPSYSVLGHTGWQAAGMPPLRDWREAIAAAHADHAQDFLRTVS